jgi:hypothetical protein
MKTTNLTSRLAAVAALLLTIAIPAPAGELGDMMEESGWNRILGTWGDQDSNGSGIKITYSWKFEGTLLEMNGTFGERTSTALIGLNAKTKEIIHTGADDKGGTSHGKWVPKDDDLTLKLATVTGEGEEGTMNVLHHFKDDDTLILTIARDEPIVLTLVRLKK